MIEDDRLKIENRLRDGAILDPRSSIFDPQSSILNLRSSTLDPPGRDLWGRWGLLSFLLNDLKVKNYLLFRFDAAS
jgi:hypothetical protein